jgi:hypothetical protein
MNREINDVGSVVKPHPIMKKLEAVARDESIVPLDGFLGESDESTFRLYKRLDPDDCYVIPKDVVVETAQIPGDEQGRIRLFLKASGRIMRIRRSSITAESLQEPVRVLEMRPRLPELQKPAFRNCVGAQNRYLDLLGQLGHASPDEWSDLMRQLSEAWDDVKEACAPPNMIAL